MTGTNREGRPPRRHHLAWRFGLVLCLGVAALFSLLGWWNVSTQRKHMIRLTEQAAARCSTLIRSATRDGMLHNDPERVQGTIQAIAASDSVHRVRILDRDGTVRRTSHPGEGDEVIPLSAFQCQICHSVDPIPSALSNQRRMQVREIDSGEQYLTVVEPIPNEPECSTGACHFHPPDRRILGIIDIELPLGEVNQQLVTSELQLGLGLFVTLAALLSLTLWLTWSMVLKPVRELADATAKVGGGDLSARVPVRSNDEMGRMAVRWNHTVEELQKARAELEEWGHTLEHRVEAKTEELESAHQRMVVVEKMAALGKLAAVVAHEINNPLAGIATYARLMQKRCRARGDDEPDEDTLKALTLMETEATRCGTIVRNLLLFSRTPGARFAPEELPPIVERCVMLVQHKADLQEIVVEVKAADDLPRVVCDAAQIQQVVLALVMNAIEAMPEGGTLTLGLTKDPQRDGVMLQVTDTGCGIPAEALGHIYEPFYSTKQQGEGVGLGLSVVYGIVERHNGEIGVESKPDEGTTFLIRLPRTQPHEPETEDDVRDREELA